jgi:hypothetical protein
MDHLFKGGILWLPGMPLIGVVAAYMLHWI